MECPRCQHINPAQAKFCMDCGAKLPARCPNCDALVPEGARFCRECGERVSRQSAVSSPQSSPDADNQLEDASQSTQSTNQPLGAERRQLTVMFCDLVGSTALSEQLDPEELRELIQGYQSVCDEVIRRHQGHIHQYLGDGVFAFFGYPQAFEDDARRAVSAGLDILEGMRVLNERIAEDAPHLRLNGNPLLVRVGIHTGLVVVGELSGTVQVLGETTNLASRLQGEAEENTLVVSAATHHLIEGYFQCKPLGGRRLKGISRLVEVYQVLGEGPVHSRLEASLAKGLNALVGRDREIGHLVSCWEKASAGAGQVVWIQGEAGIGKSRLVYALREKAQMHPRARILETRCLPHYEHTAFYPMIELLRSELLNFGEEDGPEEKLQQLKAWALQCELDPAEAISVLAGLLSVPLNGSYTPVMTSSDKQKEQTQRVLIQSILSQAHAHPVLLILEDLHWMDSATLELLDALVGEGAILNLMILITSRPEFTPSWSQPDHLSRLELHRLEQNQVEALVERITGGKSLPGEVISAIIERTDGVPLFVEELTQMILESGWLKEEEEQYALMEPLPLLAIPATLQDSLTARLDRLATAKEIAQLAATIGREFSWELLAAVAGKGEDHLKPRLEQLEVAGLIQPRQRRGLAVYQFKHALVRDAAYQSLLLRDRRRYHRRIGQILEERFPEQVAAQPEVVAYHYTEAGLPEQAVTHWQAAGRSAAKCCANKEAVAHLEKGLTLLKDLPESSRREEKELDLLLSLGSLKGALYGYADPSVEELYNRAWKICQGLSGNARLIPVLWGLHFFYAFRSEHSTVMKIGRQLLSLARQEGDPMYMIQGHFLLGSTLTDTGAIEEGKKQLEQGAYLYDPTLHHFPPYYVDPGISTMLYLSYVLLLMGYPGQAEKIGVRSEKITAQQNNPLDRAHALFFRSLFCYFSEAYGEALTFAEAAIQISVGRGYNDLALLGRIVRGGALVHLDRRKEGKTLLEENIAAFEQGGNENRLVLWLAMQGEAHLLDGEVEKGRQIVDKALAVARKNEERINEAELYRLKGRFAEMQNDGCQEAEALYRKAIEIASAQSAHLWELRASVDLARLLGRLGRKEEAHLQLEICYRWFTEGFDTPDLKKAEEVLAELESQLASR